MVKDTVLKSGKLMEKKVAERSLVRMNTISDMLKIGLKKKNPNHFHRFNTLFQKVNRSNKNHAFQDESFESPNVSDKKSNMALEEDRNVSAGSLIQMYNSDEEEETVKKNAGLKKPVSLKHDYTGHMIPERFEEEDDSEESQINKTESNKDQKSPLEIKTDAESSNSKLTPNEEIRRRIEQKISKNNSERSGLNSSGKLRESLNNSKIICEEPNFEMSYMPFNFSKTQKFLKTKGTNYVTLKLTLF